VTQQIDIAIPRDNPVIHYMVYANIAGNLVPWRIPEATKGGGDWRPAIRFAGGGGEIVAACSPRNDC
jgi:hypothetical protein